MASSQPVALITGASSGLGKFAARGLIDAGFEVVGTSRENCWAPIPDPWRAGTTEHDRAGGSRIEDGAA